MRKLVRLNKISGEIAERLDKNRITSIIRLETVLFLSYGGDVFVVSFEAFRAVDGVPIYLQIQTYIRRGCVAGTIRDGDELPSRRVLSALLGVNPNTVQKAFRLLEDEGLIASHSGAKSYVTVDEGKLAALRQTLLREELRAVTRSLRQMGIAREDALRLISEFWEETLCENT